MFLDTEPQPPPGCHITEVKCWRKKVVSPLGVVDGLYTMYLQAVSERLLMLWQQLHTATQGPLSAT